MWKLIGLKPSKMNSLGGERRITNISAVRNCNKITKVHGLQVSDLWSD